MHRSLGLCLGLVVLFVASAGRADETCLPRLGGQEEYVYVWTLGMDGSHASVGEAP